MLKLLLQKVQHKKFLLILQEELFLQKVEMTRTGFSRFGRTAFANNPVVVVRKSNKAKKNIEMIIPHFAMFPDFAA